MYDDSTLRLLHPHGDDLHPMLEVGQGSSHYQGAPDRDVERELVRGGRLFRCSACEQDVVVVAAEGEESASGGRSGSRDPAG